MKNPDVHFRLRLLFLAFGLLFITIAGTAFLIDWPGEQIIRLVKDPFWTGRIILASRNPTMRPYLKYAIEQYERNPASLESLIYTHGSSALSSRQAGGAEEFRMTFPHTANGTSGGLTYVSTVLIINNGGATASGTIYLRQSNGAPMVVSTNLGVGSQFAFELFAGEILKLETDGSGALGTGWIEVVSDMELSGTGAFTALESGRFLGAVGIGDSVRSQQLMVFVDRTEEKGNAIAICNPSLTTAAQLNLELRRLDGNLMAQKSMTLQPGTQSPGYVAQIFSGTDLKNFKGALVVKSSTVPVAMINLRTRGTDFTSLPAVPAPDPGDDEGRNLYLARIADGAYGDLRYNTTVLLLNNSTSAINATVRFRSVTGADLYVRVAGYQASQFAYTIPAGGAVELATDGSSNPAVVGWVEVNADGPLGGGGSFAMRNAKSGAFISEVGVPDSPLNSQPEVFVQETSDVATGFAVTNQNDSAVTLQIRLKGRQVVASKAGGIPTLPEVEAETNVELAAGEHLGVFISQLFSEVPAIAARQFEGRAEVLSYRSGLGKNFPLPVTGMALLSRGAQLTTVPFADYVNNFGPRLDFVPATHLASSRPSFCLEMGQLAGEQGIQTATMTLSKGSFDFSGLEDAEQVGDLLTRVQTFLFVGRNYVTNIASNSAEFYGQVTMDGSTEIQTFVGSVKNLPSGGVEFGLTSNVESISKVFLSSNMDICFDAGLLQLPSSGPLVLTEEYASKIPEGGPGYESSRIRSVSLDAPAAGVPQIRSVSDWRVVGGQTIEITGTGFSASPSGNQVTVEGNSRVAATVQEASSTRLLVKLPDHLRRGPLTVTVGGKASNPYQLEALFAPHVGLTLDRKTPGTNSELELEITQLPRELYFLRAEVKPDKGEWITNGLTVGSVAGTITVTTGVGSDQYELRVASSDASSLSLEGFAEGDSEATYALLVDRAGGTLLFGLAAMNYSGEALTPTSVKLDLSARIYKLPAASSSQIVFEINVDSMPERTMILETVIRTTEQVAITSN